MSIEINRTFLKKGCLALSVFLLSGQSFVFAQQQQQQQNQQQQQQNQQQQDVRPATAMDSIDIVRDYRPILADAVKIRRSPDLSNKREYQPKLSYQVIDKKLDITTGTKQLSIQTMPVRTTLEDKENFVKLAAGNFSTFLAEAHLSNSQYKDSRFGAYLKHFNQLGKGVDQNFSHQSVGVYGSQIQDGFTLSGTLGYNRDAYRYFGVHNLELDRNLVLNSPINADRQAYNDVFLDVALVSNPESALVENSLSYSVKLNGYLFNDKFNAKENNLGLSGYFKKRYNSIHIGAEAEADFVTNKALSYDTKNTILSLRPFIEFAGEGYEIRLGANLINESGDSSRFNVLPTASVDFALAPEYFHVFGGITGGVIRNSMKDMTAINPYLSQDLVFANSFERFHVYGGFKGNAGATFGYKLRVYYNQIENMAMFLNNPDAPATYQLIYEPSGKSTSIFGVEGEILLRVSEMINVGGNMNIRNYTMPTEEHAWYLPNFELGANARFNINDKLYIDGELRFLGETYGKAIEIQGMPGDLNYGQYYNMVNKTMPAFLDLSAGATYKITNQFSLFGRVNNIFNTKYERFNYYPALGMNVFGGLTFSF